MTIPFEKYLNIRSAYGPSFAPDGRRLAFLTNITGVPQVWAVDARGGWPDQLTFEAERVSGAWYSPTDDRLIFARDVGGNENAQLFLVNGNGSGERRLTHNDDAMHIFGGWSPHGRQIVFSANWRERGRYDIYVQEVEGGDEQIVWQNDTPGIVSPAGFSPDGARVLVFFLHGSLNHDLYEITLADRAVRHLTPHAGDVRYSRPAYSADGASVYCACDLGREFTALMQITLSGLCLQWVAEPEWDVEFPAVSLDGRYLAWATNVHGVNTITVRDLRSGETRQSPELPPGVVSPPPDTVGLVFSSDGRQLAFSFSTSCHTTDVWIWEADTVRPVTQSSHAGVPTSSFVEPELVHYPTFDGRKIPAWFYRPTSSAGERRPVVVYVHGGPEGQTIAMLFPILQYLVHRSYAVFAPNVRGSTGYGKSFSHLDDVEKRMDSVTDLAHAAYWLREQPEVDPARIAVYGGSYGGFMVLSALTTYPDLWAAGVDIVGISNFVTFLENTSAYRRSAREAEYGRLECNRDFLTRISPIHYVDQIRAPLMVIHGANDPRVPLGEAEQMVAALRARNVPVELLVYADEGHGLVKLANKLDAYPKVADFLDEHLAMR
jgi:Dipeptidyl aminopeptidases/acylaminoacyl-peptidases